MYKNYKCTATGKRYSVWAKPSGCFEVIELWDDHFQTLYWDLPATFVPE